MAAAAATDSNKDEVARLKLMIQTLQQQNAHLRSQCLASGSGNSSTNHISTGGDVICTRVSDHPRTPTSMPIASDNTDSKRTNYVSELPEEECWLFRPSKNLIKRHSSIKSAVQWTHDALDSPLSPLAPYRKDLLIRLEYLLTPGSGQTKSFSFSGDIPSLISEVSEGVHLTAHSISSSINGIHNNSSTFVESFGPRNFVDTATFKRPRRNLSDTLNCIGFAPSLGSMRTDQYPAPTEKASLRDTGSFDDLNSIVDLQAMARMQEDSLKAQVAAMAVAAAARRGSQLSLTSSNQSAPEESTSAPESPYSSLNQLNQSSSAYFPTCRTPDSLISQMKVANFLANHVGRVDCFDGVGGGEASIGLSGGDYLLQSPLPAAMMGVQYTERSGVEAGQTVVIGRPHIMPHTSAAKSTKLPITAKSALLGHPRLSPLSQPTHSGNASGAQFLPLQGWGDTLHQLPPDKKAMSSFRVSSDNLDSFLPRSQRLVSPRCRSSQLSFAPNVKPSFNK